MGHQRRTVERLRHLEDERDLAQLATFKTEGGDDWIPHEEVGKMLDKQLASEGEE